MKKKPLLYFFLIIIIALMAYYPVIYNTFVNWDDFEYVISNEMIKELSLNNLKRIFSTFHMGNYHPVSLISLLIDYQLFQDKALGYYITNLFIHILNAIVLFFLLSFILKNTIFAFVIAVFFTVHTMNVETVAWISERKNLLYSFFFLVSLIFYLRYRDKNKYLFYFLSIFFFVISLLSKPMAVTLPLILLLYDISFLNFKERKIFYEKIPFFAFAIFFSILALFSQKKVILIGGRYNIFDRFFLVGYNYFFYIFKMFFPVKLSVFYPFPEKVNNFLPVEFYLSIIIFFLIVLALRFRKNNKIIFFGLFWYLITLLPVSQIIPFGRAIVADRYFYIPSVGLMMAVVSLILSVNIQEKIKKFIKMLFFILFISLLFLTQNRVRVWRDSVNLWSDVLMKYPNATIAYLNLSMAFYDKKEYDEALRIINLGVSKDKNNPDFLYNRAKVFTALNDYKKALEDYDKVINIDKGNFKAYNNKGNIFLMLNKIDDAIMSFNKAIELEPNFTQAYYNRAISYAKINLYEYAINDYLKVIELDSKFLQAYNNLGVIYAKLKQYDKAIEFFDKALKLKPDFNEAFHNREKAYKLLNKNKLQ